MAPVRLPVDEVLPELIEALRRGPAVVLEAPPGAGKSTRVPPALVDSDVVGDGLILILEPRRAAARAVARRLASERGEAVGQTFGYQVRFESRRSRNTRALVVTEGILTRRFVGDPFIEDISCVVLDEFHERSIHVDLALAFLRELMEVRDDLKVVVMSATLDARGVATWLGRCPVVRCEGRRFPLAIQHGGHRDKREITGQTVAAVQRLLGAVDDDGGDILVFLPGAPEIHRARRALEDARLKGSPSLIPLYGALSAREQDCALTPGPGRRVVLATNIAETSLTIEGVTAVVDTGLVKIMRHDVQRGMNRLELLPISQASATQRAGRAGRTAPGRVMRLWSEAEHAYLPEADTPAIRRVDLAPALLQVLAFQPIDPFKFEFFEAPPPERLALAVALLRQLGALEPGGYRLTSRGERLGALPLHPRAGAVLLRAVELGVGEAGALAAAMLGEGDFLRRRGESPTVRSDLAWRVAVFEELEAAGFADGALARWGADGRAARGIARARAQLMRVVRGLEGDGRPDKPAGSEDEALRRALLAGYPDRLCRRRRPGEPEAVMVGGGGVSLATSSGVREGRLFVALDVEAGRRGERSDGVVRQASEVTGAWLAADFPHLVDERVEAVFDAASQAVVGRRVRRFDDLLLSEHRGAKLPDGEAAEALARAAAEGDAWVRVFKPDKGARRLLQRWRFAARVLPEEGWPDVSDEALQAWLPELCYGRRSFADLASLDWTAELKGRLPWSFFKRLDDVAPDRLTVPSGSHIALDYEPALGPTGAPVLAVRLQELFGLGQTPTVAHGRVPVLLHLLAPNRRPVQVTRDLQSFWNNTYAEVRKEMRQRYPKHSWPEDPWTAEPLRGTKRRR